MAGRGIKAGSYSHAFPALLTWQGKSSGAEARKNFPARSPLPRSQQQSRGSLPPRTRWWQREVAAGGGSGARATEGKSLLALLLIRAAERCRTITGKAPLNGPGPPARTMASRRLKSAALPLQARRILLSSIFGSGTRSSCASSFRNRASKLRSCSAFEVRGKAGKCNCGSGRGKVY